MRKSFRFKQFEVSDENCAMKLGTDAVLLGSWVSPPTEGEILDIGCGCGILSLMMAQKSGAEITGVEIHPPSADVARMNISNSSWNARIKVSEGSLQNFAEQCHGHFNLIISNPPYFTDSLKTPSPERRLSRHNDSLSHEELLGDVIKLLDIQGAFSLILPSNLSEPFIQLAFTKGLYLTRRLNIRSRPAMPVIRCCMEFSTTATATTCSELAIRNSDNSYSEAYKTLTKDFYL